MATRRHIVRLNLLHPIAPAASGSATREAAAGGSAKRQSEASESGSAKRQREAEAEAAAGSANETVEINSNLH